MRELFDRFGWFVQFAMGVAVFVALTTGTTLHLWAAGLAALGASYVGTWLLAIAMRLVFGE